MNNQGRIELEQLRTQNPFITNAIQQLESSNVTGFLRQAKRRGPEHYKAARIILEVHQCSQQNKASANRNESTLISIK